MRTARFFHVAAAALLVCACAARPKRSLPPAAAPDPLEAVISAILKKADAIPERTIALHDITDITGNVSNEGRLITERLTSRLASSGAIRVIERRRLEAAMKELSLSASGAVNEAGVAKAGYLSGAGAVLIGTLTRIADGFELNARAINVMTGDVIAAATALIEIDLLPSGGTVRRLHPPPAGAGKAPSADAPPGWQAWPGRGKAAFEDGRIRYCLERRQIDHSDNPQQGYYPGLLLEREITGDKWIVEIIADYRMNISGGHWLSAFIWLGEEGTRPHQNGAKNALSLIARRCVDRGYSLDGFQIQSLPGGELVSLGPEIDSIRFERKGNLFTVSAGAAGKNYKKALSLFSPKGGAAPSQRIVLGGQAFDDPGSCAEYLGITLNGEPLF